MPTAKKLPSGSWRCQVYSHTEEILQPDGTIKHKRVYRSFTSDVPGSKGKRLAEQMAADFAAGKEQLSHVSDMPVSEAVRLYIDSKAAVLSQSTLRGYESLYRNYFLGSDIGRMRTQDLDNTRIQKWVSGLSARLSPKTVRNAHALLSSTLEVFAPDFRLKTTLPAKRKPDLYVPSDADILVLLRHVQGRELEIAVLLAAFGPLRRGEICALESQDISGSVVTVRRNMVLGPDRAWHVKQPKTYSGYRDIEFPDFVIQRMTGIEGRIVKATPDQITRRFQRAVQSAGLPHFRFHDLRHYAASIMHAIGVQDQYIVARGGWATDSVMKSVYRGVITDEMKKQSEKINTHFERMQHEMQHEK